MTRAPLQLMGDERLAHMAAAGDRRAFDVLFERHRRGLQCSARSIVGNEHDAQDALQSAALKAFVGLAGRSPDAPLRPWLYRIASNEAISVLRRRRARPSEELGELVADAAGGPEELLLVREDLRHLLEDLEHISARQRAALLMRQALGLDYDEIGRRLDTTPLAARQCVFAARRALRRTADGREASCAAVRVTIASGDGRALRAAPIRAHLRTCPECRAATPPSRVRTRVAALLPTAPSGLVAVLRTLLSGPSSETIAAPAKALAVAAVLTVGAGEATLGGDAAPRRATAAATPRHASATPKAKPKAAAAAPHVAKVIAVARAVPVVTRTVAVRAAPVTHAVVRHTQAPARELARRHPVAPEPVAAEPERQFADAPAAEPEPQAELASARCHDPAAPATSQPAPTPG